MNAIVYGNKERFIEMLNQGHPFGHWQAVGTTITAYSDKSVDGAIVAEANSHFYSPETCRANARLIASAPELLEACEATLTVLCADSDSEEDNAKEIAQLRAAIAKAKEGAL